MKQKTDFLRKTNNTDKPLAKLKKEKKRHKLPSNRNEIGDISNRSCRHSKEN